MPGSHLLRKTLSSLRRTTGFTLIELLASMAIIFLMASILMPAVRSLGYSSALSTDGVRLTDLINRARQNSMSKNVMTALLVNDDPASENRGKTMALFELSAPKDGSSAQSSDWKQSSQWERLQTGVIVDPNSDGACVPAYNFTFNKMSDTSGSPGVPTPALPVIKESGQTVSSFRYAVFLPNGSLLAEIPVQIRLAEGSFSVNGAGATYSRPNGNGKPANYYDVVILSATGRVKTYRP